MQFIACWCHTGQHFKFIHTLSNLVCPTVECRHHYQTWSKLSAVSYLDYFNSLFIVSLILAINLDGSFDECRADQYKTQVVPYPCPAWNLLWFLIALTLKPKFLILTYIFRCNQVPHCLSEFVDECFLLTPLNHISLLIISQTYYKTKALWLSLAKTSP